MAKIDHFGKIRKRLDKFFRVVFGIWLKFEHTLANVYGIGQSFIVLKWQILNKPNGHLVTL